MRDINGMSRENNLVRNRRNLLNAELGRPDFVLSKGFLLAIVGILVHLDLLNSLAISCYETSPEV